MQGALYQFLRGLVGRCSFGAPMIAPCLFFVKPRELFLQSTMAVDQERSGALG